MITFQVVNFLKITLRYCETDFSIIDQYDSDFTFEIKMKRLSAYIKRFYS